jgi:hypothetical protein
MKRLYLLFSLLTAFTVSITGFSEAAADDTTTSISGEIVGATITVIPPSPINFPQFKVGDMTGMSSVPGKITIIPGTDSYPIAYAVHVSDANTGAGRGFMMSGATPLSPVNKMMISQDGINYFPSDEGFTYSGVVTGDNETVQLPLFARQTITGNETRGMYSITLSFKASLP